MRWRQHCHACVVMWSHLLDSVKVLTMFQKNLQQLEKSEGGAIMEKIPKSNRGPRKVKFVARHDVEGKKKYAKRGRKSERYQGDERMSQISQRAKNDVFP